MEFSKDFNWKDWYKAGWRGDVYVADKWHRKGFSPAEGVYFGLVVGIDPNDPDFMKKIEAEKKRIEKIKEIAMNVMIDKNTEEDIQSFFKWCDENGFFNPLRVLSVIERIYVYTGYPESMKKNPNAYEVVEFGNARWYDDRYAVIRTKGKIYSIYWKFFPGEPIEDDFGGATGFKRLGYDYTDSYFSLHFSKGYMEKDFHEVNFEAAIYFNRYYESKIEKAYEEEERKRKEKEHQEFQERMRKLEEEREKEMREFEEKYLGGKNIMRIFYQFSKEEQHRVCQLIDPYNALFDDPRKRDIYEWLKEAERKIEEYRKDGWDDFAEDYEKLVRKFYEKAGVQVPKLKKEERE